MACCLCVCVFGWDLFPHINPRWPLLPPVYSFLSLSNLLIFFYLFFPPSFWYLSTAARTRTLIRLFFFFPSSIFLRVWSFFPFFLPTLSLSAKSQGVHCSCPALAISLSSLPPSDFQSQFITFSGLAFFLLHTPLPPKLIGFHYGQGWSEVAATHTPCGYPTDDPLHNPPLSVFPVRPYLPSPGIFHFNRFIFLVNRLQFAPFPGQITLRIEPR